jgi:hypothetical protein
MSAVTTIPEFVEKRSVECVDTTTTAKGLNAEYLTP